MQTTASPREPASRSDRPRGTGSCRWPRPGSNRRWAARALTESHVGSGRGRSWLLSAATASLRRSFAPHGTNRHLWPNCSNGERGLSLATCCTKCSYDFLDRWPSGRRRAPGERLEATLNHNNLSLFPDGTSQPAVVSTRQITLCRSLSTVKSTDNLHCRLRRRDLNRRPPEPHSGQELGQIRHIVAFTRCSGHRCRI